MRENDTLPWQPRNFQVLNTSGWTLQTILNSPYGWLAAHNANLNLSYTYLNQTVQASDDMISKYAIEILRHQFTGTFHISVVKGMDVTVSGRYLQRVNGNDYTVADLRLSYSWKQWQIFADANNILDTQYKETGTILMPGRWFNLGLRFRTNFNTGTQPEEK